LASVLPFSPNNYGQSYWAFLDQTDLQLSATGLQCHGMKNTGRFLNNVEIVCQ